MAYDKALQINSFAVIDEGIDLKHNSFGKTYEDYLEGTFWSRTWVNGGASAQDIKGEFPLLFIEQKLLTMEAIDSNDLTLPFYFVVVDKIACDACPPGLTRTSEEVLANTLVMLRRVFKELMNYKLFAYDIVSPPSSAESWATQGRIDYLTTEGTIVNADWKSDFEGILPSVNLVKVVQWGNFDSLRAHATEIPFTVCDPTTGSFNYENATVEDLGRTICKNC